MKRFITIIIITIIFNFILKGEQDSFFKDILIEGQYHYGFLWPHHTSIAYSINGHVPGFEFNILNYSNNKNIWDNLYHNPRKGFGMSYFYMQDHEIFGSAIGLYGLFDIPIIRNKTFNASYRIYGGLSWLTKIWDIKENYNQTAIGTHINLYFRGSLTCRYKISPSNELIIGTGLTHFSNGNIKEPNLGLNIVTPSIGFVHNFISTEQDNEIEQKEIPDLNKFNLSLIYSGGIKAINGIYNDYYYKCALNIHLGYNINHISQVGTGIDFLYDGTQKNKWEESNSKKNKSDLLQLGYIIYHDLIYKKLILTVQAGTYLYNRHDYRMIYNRIGLKYKISKKILTTLSLKSHKTQADYIEWGIGYIL
ncbi:acyloxyacyl hydrolase [Bacteroidota bacterium]